MMQRIGMAIGAGLAAALLFVVIGEGHVSGGGARLSRAVADHDRDARLGAGYGRAGRRRGRRGRRRAARPFVRRAVRSLSGALFAVSFALPGWLLSVLSLLPRRPVVRRRRPPAPTGHGFRSAASSPSRRLFGAALGVGARGFVGPGHTAAIRRAVDERSPRNSSPASKTRSAASRLAGRRHGRRLRRAMSSGCRRRPGGRDDRPDVLRQPLCSPRARCRLSQRLNRPWPERARHRWCCRRRSALAGRLRWRWLSRPPESSAIVALDRLRRPVLRLRPAGPGGRPCAVARPGGAPAAADRALSRRLDGRPHVLARRWRLLGLVESVVSLRARAGRPTP